MKKSIQNLKENHFDLAIVGSGIHGAVLALEAVRAGYKVALLEKDDFGHSTSANSLKIIHGGIRYLQHGDFKRMRESILSRRSMMTFAPHLVRPLACLMPTYGHGIKGREMMRIAFGVYDLVAFDRNKGLDAATKLPCGGSISAREVEYEVPGINSENLTGGAVWYDAIANNTERLILEYVKEAARYGAVTANYTKAKKVLTHEENVQGLAIEDVGSGELFNISCDSVVNAAGPWLGDIIAGQNDFSGQQWATAVNLVVKKRLFKKYAVGLEGYTDYTDKDALIKRGKRLFFFVPWLEDYTMIGTTYKPYSGKIDDFKLQQEDLREILEDVNKIYPSGDLKMEDVSFFHGGLLPMTESDEAQQDSVQLDKSSRIIDHGKTGGVRGLYSIKGVKYTTAPDIAEKVVTTLQKEKNLGTRQQGRHTAVKPVIVDSGKVIRSLGENYLPIRQHLESRYGKDWRDIFKYLALSGDNFTIDSLWLSRKPDLMEIELLYFMREEMASTMADVLFRRSSLGSAECPSKETLDTVADLMAKELGWSDEEKLKQVEEVLQVYLPLSEYNN